MLPEFGTLPPGEIKPKLKQSTAENLALKFIFNNPYISNSSVGLYTKTIKTRLSGVTEIRDGWLVFAFEEAPGPAHADRNILVFDEDFILEFSDNYDLEFEKS